MFKLARDSDTISAICTPPGTGGIAVIRVSGALALSVSRRVCPFLPEQPESHRVYYGFAIESSSGEKLDEILATYFSVGKSFTGEETIEISCHGGPVVTVSRVANKQGRAAFFDPEMTTSPFNRLPPTISN
jgi:tRNA modification GTPase